MGILENKVRQLFLEIGDKPLNSAKKSLETKSYLDFNCFIPNKIIKDVLNILLNIRFTSKDINSIFESESKKCKEKDELNIFNKKLNNIKENGLEAIKDIVILELFNEDICRLKDSSEFTGIRDYDLRTIKDIYFSISEWLANKSFKDFEVKIGYLKGEFNTKDFPKYLENNSFEIKADILTKDGYLVDLIFSDNLSKLDLLTLVAKWVYILDDNERLKEKVKTLMVWNPLTSQQIEIDINKISLGLINDIRKGVFNSYEFRE